MNSGNNALLIAGSIIATGIVIALGIVLAGSGSGGTINSGNGNGGNVNFDIMPVTAEDHIRGSMNADVIMVEYSDVGCIHCQNLHGVLNRIVEEYEDDEFAWVFRHFPLRAPEEAHAAECAAELGGEDAFWGFIDEVMEQAQQTTPDGDTQRLADVAASFGVERSEFISCQEETRHRDRVRAFMTDAQQAGAQGTPFNVFITKNEITESQRTRLQTILGNTLVISEDNTMMILPGGLPFDMLKEVIDALRQTEEV